MKIIQFTDIHLTSDNSKAYEVDVWNNLDRALKLGLEWHPNLLVFSGDIAFKEGDPAIYRKFSRYLHDTIPEETRVAVLSGNHDDPALLASEFGLDNALHPDGLYYDSETDNAHLIFLDSTKKKIEKEQLDYLGDICKDIRHKPLIFIHHPPFYAGIPYMDENHSIENPADLARAVSACSVRPAFFSGHYHTEKSYLTPEGDVFLTPSTFYQIDPVSRKFKLASYQFGFRLIEWNGNTLFTSVHMMHP